MNEKGKLIRNYFIVGFIVLFTIGIAIYFYVWYRTYEVEKLNTPIMSNYLQVIHYNEVDNYLTENGEAILYVSKLNDVEIRNFEKKFKRIITKYSLNNILYLDVSNNIYNFDMIDNKYFSNIPFIIIFRKGKIDSYFSIEESNYNLNMLIDYLKDEGLIND